MRDTGLAIAVLVGVGLPGPEAHARVSGAPAPRLKPAPAPTRTDAWTPRGRTLVREARSGRRLEHASIGLSLSGTGLLFIGAGVLALAGNDPGYWPSRTGLYAGTPIMALGLAGLLSAVPVGIAGAIRRRLAHADGAPSLVRRYVTAGLLVSAAGLALAGAGGILLSINARDLSGAAGVSGLTLLPLGVLTLLFGMPMWLEPLRATWLGPPPKAAAAVSWRLADPHPERSAQRGIARWLPRTVLLGGVTYRF